MPLLRWSAYVWLRWTTCLACSDAICSGVPLPQYNAQAAPHTSFTCFQTKQCFVLQARELECTRCSSNIVLLQHAAQTGCRMQSSRELPAQVLLLPYTFMAAAAIRGGRLRQCNSRLRVGQAVRCRLPPWRCIIVCTISILLCSYHRSAVAWWLTCDWAQALLRVHALDVCGVFQT